MQRFSVCITNYNSISTIKQATESVLHHFRDRGFEIVISDNMSSDGSFEYLRELEREGLVDKLFRCVCSRGKGRDLSFRNSTGDHIICNIDMDVVYDTVKIDEAISEYISIHDDVLFAAYGMIIISRKLANELGGWRDLDRHEDSDISARALSVNRYVQNFGLNVVRAHLKKKVPPILLSSLRLTYLDCRDWYRIGMPLMTGLKRGRLRLLTLLSYILSRFMERYPNQNIPEYLEILYTDRYYRRPADNPR
jgi:glycosyltransferase involved in cell wall biosynthesis